MSEQIPASAAPATSNQQLARTVDTAVKFLGDFALVPGASQVMSGQIGSGVTHAAAGLVGSMLLGPMGWVLAAANSFSRSVTSQNLIQNAESLAQGSAKPEPRPVGRTDRPRSELTDDQLSIVMEVLKEAHETDPKKRTPAQKKLVEHSNEMGFTS